MRFTRIAALAALFFVIVSGPLAVRAEEAPRGYLGMRIQPVTFKDMQRLKLPSAAGVMVQKVLPNGPAEVAGLRDGDIIVRYAGAKIAGFSQMLLMAQVAVPGDKVEVTFWRGGAEHDAVLTVVERPALANLVDAKTDFPAFGLMISDLTPSLRQQAGVDNSATGVVVVGVSGPAATAEVKELDIITAVGGKQVVDLKGFEAELAAARAASADGTILFRLHRGRERIAAALSPTD